jgi:hypothetical protein
MALHGWHALAPQRVFDWHWEARQRAQCEAGENGRAFVPAEVEACRP